MHREPIAEQNKNMNKTQVQSITHPQGDAQCHELPDIATFFDGGVPVRLPVSSESISSTLRFVPTFESGDRGGDKDFLKADGGGVDRELPFTSGVPPRLEEMRSLRNRAARVLVDERASA